MSKKTSFYAKLSPSIKQHYNAQERIKPHSTRFKELMDRTEKIDKYYYHTVEEIRFLGDEDLPVLMDLFESEAMLYMED